MYIYLIKHYINLRELDPYLSELWAKFLVYEDILNAPEALTMWAKYAIYEAIDKIPQICHVCGSMWGKMVLSGGLWRAVQLHVY